jgi:2-polyprenyl-3-methyl-5-hydroxy-6-metoxy-1,4-benzoquinol methylase
MISSKEWNWELERSSIWLEPCEEGYYFCRRWKKEDRHSILDLGCGLGRHAMLFAREGFQVLFTKDLKYKFFG